MVRESGPGRLDQQLYDLCHHLVVMPDPGVPAFIEADEPSTDNLVRGVLRAGVGAVAVITRADDQRR